MLFCKNPIYNFGQAKEGDKVAIVFDLTNTSESQLEVLKLSASCGCSTPTLPKTLFEPNETIQMTVVFDTIGKRGTNEKSIWVDYKLDGKELRTTCKFIGIVN